jgi:hypothetical protein
MFKGLLRRLQVAALLLLALLPMQRANAVIGTLDVVPAATLLIPYFEVDLDNATGRNTLIGLTNTSATALLANVTLWTNTGVPVFGFNVYLTGYDVITMNMRTIMDGTLPLTASAGQDPGNTISPKGLRSQDINFASCQGQLPYNTPVVASYVADLKLSFTGRPSTVQFAGRCVGTNLGDNVARGYVTINTVNNCTFRKPNEIGYFSAGGTGDATNQNILLGDYTLIDVSQNVMNMDNAVHIEADAANPLTSTPGNYTFYGRNVAWTAADNREPLATNWRLQGETNNTNAVIWRDPKVTPNSFVCASQRPSWAPLNQEQIAFFEPSSIPTRIPPSPTIQDPFPPPVIVAPVATQNLAVNFANMGVPSALKFGAVALNLNTFVAPAGSNPPNDPTASQSFVTVLRNHKNLPRLSTGANATPMDSATAPSHNLVGF